MKAARLLSELLLLQAHGQLTGREIAKRLEVSERTVHRDMEALSAAGVPVFALRGVRGGWQLDEHWRTQVPGLDEAELHALLMAQPRVLGDVRLAAAAERALGKLMASLPEALRERAASIQQRLFVDTTGWRSVSEHLSMLPVVQDAVSRDRKLAFWYARAGRERTERIVDPLGLVAKGSVWYLVARSVVVEERDSASGETNPSEVFRTYRVSRMEEARLLDEPSERPADFDLAAYWKASTEALQEAWSRYRTILRVEPLAAKELKMWRTASPADDPDLPDAEGWVRLRVQFDDEQQALFVVLGLGARVEVVEPASLRERVTAEINTILARRATVDASGSLASGRTRPSPLDHQGAHR